MSARRSSGQVHERDLIGHLMLTPPPPPIPLQHSTRHWITMSSAHRRLATQLLPGGPVSFCPSTRPTLVVIRPTLCVSVCGVWRVWGPLPMLALKDIDAAPAPCLLGNSALCSAVSADTLIRVFRVFRVCDTD